MNFERRSLGPDEFPLVVGHEDFVFVVIFSCEVFVYDDLHRILLRVVIDDGMVFDNFCLGFHFLKFSRLFAARFQIQAQIRFDWCGSLFGIRHGVSPNDV